MKKTIQAAKIVTSNMENQSKLPKILKLEMRLKSPKLTVKLEKVSLINSWKTSLTQWGLRIKDPLNLSKTPKTQEPMNQTMSYFPRSDTQVRELTKIFSVKFF